MRFLRELRWRLFSSRREYVEGLRYWSREADSLQQAIIKTYGKEEADYLRRYSYDLRQEWVQHGG